MKANQKRLVFSILIRFYICYHYKIEEKIKGVRSMIYFDNSATTRPFKEVIETYIKVSQAFFGNPSSLHTLGKEAERLLDQGRVHVAKLLNVNKNEIIFTSGGTEGNNLAIKGTALQHKGRGKHLITSKIEHASNYEAYAQLEKYGFRVTYLNVNHEGLICVEELKQALCDDTILVSLVHVNNELGSVQPIKQVGQLLKEFPKIYFHVDDVQGIGKVPLDVKNCFIDLYTISGHKFHGPKGTGVLYARQGVKLESLFTGGIQENKMRAGTENIPAIIGMVKALRMTFENTIERINHLNELKEHLLYQLRALEDIVINTPVENSAPHIVNFSIKRLKPEVMISALSESNIYVSTKSACSSKLAEPSRVLIEAGLGKERAETAIRVSFAFDNTIEEVDHFILVLSQLIPQLKEVMR